KEIANIVLLSSYQSRSVIRPCSARLVLGLVFGDGDYCLSAPRSGAEFVGNIDVTEAHQSLKYGLVHLGSAGLPSGPDLPCFGRGYRSRKWRTTSWRTPAFVTGASDPRHGERRRPMIRAAFTSAWICHSHQRQRKRSPSRFRAST